MSETPEFTILIPATGRASLARDAIKSVLLQSFDSFEIIFSNNGADSRVYDAVRDLIIDPRVTYTEQPAVISMPDHWERLASSAKGNNILVLTDRSVLKKDALGEVYSVHKKGDIFSRVVSWPWDLYYDSGYCVSPVCSGQQVTLSSTELIRQNSQPVTDYPMVLPRALNSSVSRELIDQIQKKTGRVFGQISPDFSFAYDCLFSSPGITYLDKPLMISQGLQSSNGGGGYLSDASRYIATLGLERPFNFSPIKAPLVENTIVEDFLAAASRHGKIDAIESYDRATLYIKCFAELDAKRGAAIIANSRIELFNTDVLNALYKEEIGVQKRVFDYRNSLNMSRDKIKRAIKRFIPNQINSIRVLKFWLSGNKRFSSVLEAAGYGVE